MNMHLIIKDTARTDRGGDDRNQMAGWNSITGCGRLGRQGDRIMVMRRWHRMCKMAITKT